jgi:hypothetical protein
LMLDLLSVLMLVVDVRFVFGFTVRLEILRTLDVHNETQRGAAHSSWSSPTPGGGSSSRSSRATRPAGSRCVHPTFLRFQV